VPDTDPIVTGNRTWWWPGLLVVVGGGLAIRLYYLWHWHRHMKIAGDAFYYHYAANFFAEGRGWPLPSALLQGVYQPYAQHPPMTSALLALPSVLGFTSFFDHQFFLCLVGTVSVFICGLAGRRIGGPVTGLVAAVIAAVYPGMWIADPLVMSETPGILACSLLAWTSYRLWDRRRPLDVVWVGISLAMAMLTRAELALLAVLLVVPLALRLRDITWRRRFGYVGIAAATCAIAIGPWVGYNLSRFDRPEFIETGFGVTMAVTQCDTTYYGPVVGWWSLACADVITNAPVEASERDVYYKNIAFHYIATHESRLPVVMAARLGRTWALYKPAQQEFLDTIEERPESISKIADRMLWALGLIGVGGIVVLLRRRAAVWPLLATPLALSIASAFIYGTTRFRAVGEPSVVLLSAAALGALLTALTGRLRRQAAPVDGPDDGGEPTPFPSTGPLSAGDVRAGSETTLVLRNVGGERPGSS
jgi:hypothetical protein